MKNIILLFILLLFFPKAYSQISSSAFITFKYDDSGNQIERKFSQLNIETDKNGIKDSISTIENLIKIFPNPTKGNFYIEEYADRPAIEIDPNQTAPGSTPISIKSIKAKTVGTITFGTKAFRSYYTLYQSVGHELRHAYQIVSGIYANSLKINGGNLNRAIYSMEVDALWWNYSQNMNDLQFLKLAPEYEKKLNLNLSK